MKEAHSSSIKRLLVPLLTSFFFNHVNSLIIHPLQNHHLEIESREID